MSKPSSKRAKTPDNNSETTDASINFISDDAIRQVTLASRLGTSNAAESDFHQVDEYESDSGDSDMDDDWIWMSQISQDLVEK